MPKTLKATMWLLMERRLVFETQRKKKEKSKIVRSTMEKDI